METICEIRRKKRQKYPPRLERMLAELARQEAAHCGLSEEECRDILGLPPINTQKTPRRRVQQ